MHFGTVKSVNTNVLGSLSLSNSSPNTVIGISSMLSFSVAFLKQIAFLFVSTP